MVFNSLQFLLFFIVVYSLYRVFPHRWQNRMLLVASYIFYGAWDWRFLSLIFISTFVDYYCALLMGRAGDPVRRRRLLGVSIAANLGLLGFFKYCNFFTESLASLCDWFGVPVHLPVLRVILPVGISFYTFQTLSYTLDVYYRRIEPQKNFRDFALFVSFFPQLVAGPIERAGHLLAQVCRPRTMTRQGMAEGCFLFFWGLFQKVFIADNLAAIVDPIFNSPGPYQAAQVLLAVYAFAFQIFCDFSGYSDMARGLAKLMGFELMVNFHLPYFATNPQEFWRRWHISLSTWLRDYLYIPLGGSRGGLAATCRNLGITMLLGGLWHGAAWTFVVWGAYHGALLIVYRLFQPFLAKVSSPTGVVARQFWLAARIGFFFHLTCLGWLIFRAKSLGQVGEMLQALAQGTAWGYGAVAGLLGQFVFFVGPLVLVQGVQARKDDLLAPMSWSLPARTAFYFLCSMLLIILGVTGGQQFIYFQF